MVSFTCPCWGRGDGEGEDCRFALDVPEVNPFCPGVEETALGAEIAVETGCPLMIWVTTCWGVPRQIAKHHEYLYVLTSTFNWNSSILQMTVFFSVSKKDLWDADSSSMHSDIYPSPKDTTCQWPCFQSHHWQPFFSFCYLWWKKQWIFFLHIQSQNDNREDREKYVRYAIYKTVFP